MARSRFLGIIALSVALAAALGFTACPMDGDGHPSGGTFTVSFDAGDGSGTPPASQPVAAGTSITLPDQGNMTAPAGKPYFNGWRTGGQNYTVGGSYPVNADTVFIAQWGTSGGGNYTVNYNVGAGGGAAPPSQTEAAGTVITLPEQGNMKAPDNTIFNGWKPNNENKTFAPSGKYTVNSNTDFTAQWLPRSDTKYTVSYNAGEGGGTPPLYEEVMDGQTIALPGQGSMTAPDNSIFNGWQAGTGGTYSAGDSYTVNANTTFTAQWLGAYTVNYTTGRGGGSPPASRTVKPRDSITLPGQGSMAAPDGENFNGWKIAGATDGQNYAADSIYEVTANTTFEAQWLKPGAACTVTYLAGNGSGTPPPSVTVPEGSVIVLPDCGSNMSPPSSGQMFKCWFNNNGIFYAGSSYTVTADTTFTAEWANRCVITYNAGEGSGTLPSQTVPAGTSINLPGLEGMTPPNGQTFEGWENGGNIYYQDDTYEVNSSTAFTAQWVGACMVSYSVGDGGGTPPASQERVITGTTITLPGQGDMTPPDGKMFDGWKIDGATDGKKYAADSSYEVNETTVFIAQWVTPYTVTYDLNGGTGTPPPAQEVLPGSSITLASGSNLSKTDYAFSGWNTNSDGSGSTYTAETNYTPPYSIILYAKWEFSPIEGTVSITGDPKVGQTITADVTGLSYIPYGTLSYQWDIDGTIKGTAESYTVALEDFHKAITLTVTASENTGSKTSTPTQVLGVPLDGLTAYLDTLNPGTPETPNTVPLDAAINISDNWGTINTVVKDACKYVILNLSDCAATGNTITGSSSPSGNNFNIIKDNTYIKGIILPDSLTSIGNLSFYNCSSVTSITIPRSVTSIGNHAFYGCSGLTSVNIPNGVTGIGDQTFYGCTSLTSVTIGDNVSSIGISAFSTCTSLTSVTIPRSVTDIKMQAFYGCSSLTSVTFLYDYSEIGSNAFPGAASGSGSLIYEYSGHGAGTYTRAAGALYWRKENG